MSYTLARRGESRESAMGITGVLSFPSLSNFGETMAGLTCRNGGPFTPTTAYYMLIHTAYLATLWGSLYNARRDHEHPPYSAAPGDVAFNLLV